MILVEEWWDVLMETLDVCYSLTACEDALIETFAENGQVTFQCLNYEQSGHLLKDLQDNTPSQMDYNAQMLYQDFINIALFNPEYKSVTYDVEEDVPPNLSLDKQKIMQEAKRMRHFRDNAQLSLDMSIAATPPVEWISRTHGIYK